MARTPAQRLQLVDELRDEWWRLEQVLPDAQERSDFIWAVARDRHDLSKFFCSTLSNYIDPQHSDEAIDFVVALIETFDTEQHRGSSPWDQAAEWMIRRVSEDDPVTLHRRLGDLPEVAEDFARIFLVASDATSYGPLPDRAMRRLARAWAATSWDEPWYDRRGHLSEPEWQDLVLEALETHRHGTVEWTRIRGFAARATVEQKLAILEQDHSQHIRSHTHTMMRGSTFEQLQAFEAAFDRFDQERDYYAWHRHAALAIGLMAHGTTAGWEASQTAVDALVRDLASLVEFDIDVTAEALGALTPEQQESVLLRAMELSHRGMSRAFAVAWVAPTDAVLDAFFGHLRQLNRRHPLMLGGLVAIGPAIVGRICEVLSDGAPVETAVVSVEALGLIGDGRAAPTLVEQLGARSTEVRDAAKVALERLGASALDALRAGCDHRKKAVREASEQLVTAYELSRDNPLSELEARFDRLDHANLDAALAEAEREQASNNQSTDITRYAEQYGIFVMLRIRDWFLEAPQSWYRRETWKHVAEFFRKDPDQAWIAVDAFAKLPEHQGWELEHHVEVLARIVDRDPTKTCEAIAHYLRGRPPAHRAEMLRFLIDHAPRLAPDVFIRALKDRSKAVRELGIEGIRRAGTGPIRDVAELVTASRKQVRLAAATALSSMSAEPVVDMLQSAYASEKTAEVRTALEAAIRSAGGTAIDLPSGGDDETLDAYLAKLERTTVPGFADPDRLPTLRFGSGTPLSAAATRGFVVRLMQEGPDHADPVARDISARLDDSVHRFGGAIVDAWVDAGADPKEKWAVYQFGVTAGSAQIDAIGPTLDTLASDNNHHRAVWFLDALQRHPHPDAQSWVLHWARWADRSSVKSAAAAHLETDASNAQVSRLSYEATLNAYVADDVAERTLPTLGLECPLVVDYGVRRFEVRLGRNHQLSVVETTHSKLVDRLPAPRKAESPNREQLETYRNVRQALDVVVRDASRRLEDAMATGRPWTRDAFEGFFGAHPIAREFARRLVFVTDRGVLFRRCDGDDLSAAWDTVIVPTDAILRLAHPLDMSENDREVWSEHLADAQIVQPFEQVGRAVHPPEDRVLEDVTSYPAVTTPVFVRRRRRLGWVRGAPPEHQDLIYEAIRPLPGRGQRAVIRHQGYHPTDLQWNADQTIRVEKVWFEDFDGNELALEEIDPRAYSEVRNDLDQWFRVQVTVT